MVKKLLKLKKFREKTDVYITRLKISKAYNRLPEQIKNILRLDEEFYKLEILENIFGNEYILGHCPVIPKYLPHYRCIRIKARDNESDGYFPPIESVFYHECGHAISNELLLNGISIANEFNDIYEKEKENFVSNGNEEFYRESLDEYFAQSFSEYLLRPERLKENTPKTYEFMDKFVNEILNRQ